MQKQPPPPPVRTVQSPGVADASTPVLPNIQHIAVVLIAIVFLFAVTATYASMYLVLPIIRNLVGGLYEQLGLWTLPVFLKDGMITVESLGAVVIAALLVGTLVGVLGTVIFMPKQNTDVQ